MAPLHFSKARSMLKICRATIETFLYLQDIGSKAILSSQIAICAITCVSMNTLKIILKMINDHWSRMSSSVIWFYHTLYFLCILIGFQICSDDCARGLLYNWWKTEALQVCPKAEEQSSSWSGEFCILASRKWSFWCFLTECWIKLWKEKTFFFPE